MKHIDQFRIRQTVPKNMPVQPIAWGAATAEARGPIIAHDTPQSRRNVIGAVAGPYSIYAALAQATGDLPPDHRPDLSYTIGDFTIQYNPKWSDPKAIVTFDPWGHVVQEKFAARIAAGEDIRPTISMTPTCLSMPETVWALNQGQLKPDGRILTADGYANAVKIAIDPVWYLPGIAARLGIKESTLRRYLLQKTNNPRLRSKHMNVFLPPIGGSSVYIFGDITKLGDPSVPVTARVHDECSGSDVFSADICTCRPYLAHGVNACIEAAQAGGIGIIVYNRKEGRALGEVTKLLVYTARKGQPGGDRHETYFERTASIAGVEDARVQNLMPDIFHWLGIRSIDNWLSMSHMKYEAMTAAGIEVVNRIELPGQLIPASARIEIAAKLASGYYTGKPEAARRRSPRLACEAVTL